MATPLSKHKLSGIGKATAIMVMASLAANPASLFLTVGVPGQILLFILTKIFTPLASMGLVMLNVGAGRLEQGPKDERGCK